MRHTTTWSPDTCGCVIEYDWDTDTSEDERVHTVSKIVKECPLHKGLDIKTHYVTVLEENTRKNLAVGEIRETHPNAEVDWSFDKARNVVLNVKNVSFIDPTPIIAKIGAKVQINLV